MSVVAVGSAIELFDLGEQIQWVLILLHEME